MCNREISSRRIDWFFSAKLYDHQGPIARGGGVVPTPPPLTVRVMRNALTGRGLILAGTGHFASFHGTRGGGGVGTTPLAVSRLIELGLRGKNERVARRETKRLIYKLKALGQPVTSEVRSSAEKWRKPVIADNFASDGARAKFQRPACSLRRVEHVTMVFECPWIIFRGQFEKQFMVIWRHWPLMTRWFHDLISSLLSANWISESKSAPQITLEGSRTRKKSAKVIDLSWPRLTYVGPDDLWNAWVLLGTTCPHSYH